MASELKKRTVPFRVLVLPVAFRLLRLVLERNYGNEGLVFTLAGELDCTVYESVESVVFAHTHVEARVVNGTPLAYDDVTGFYDLLAKLLDTKALGM